MVSNIGFLGQKVHVFILLLCAENMESLYAVHVSALFGDLDYFHYILYVPICVAGVQYMLSICGCIFVVF
jgi:hypothetical protein